MVKAGERGGERGGRGANPFTFEGPLRVSSAATVIVLRRAKTNSINALTCEDLCGAGEKPNPMVFGTMGRSFEFTSGWEVLMGQNEVKNWMKSTANKTKTMTFPGEFKFAGGVVDKGESLLEAANRELEEEFLRPFGKTLPANAIIRPFIAKQTRPIRGKSSIMHNFVALEEENPWIQSYDLEDANKGLALRRARLEKELASGKFWGLSDNEKEDVSPEVREIKWMSLRDAMSVTLSSMSSVGKKHPSVFVNDFQRTEFERYGVTRRDPMFITCAALMELEGFPTTRSLIRWCEQQGADMQAMVKAEQWLFEGDSSEAVDAAFAKRVASTRGLNPSFKRAADVAILREQRRAQDNVVPEARL